MCELLKHSDIIYTAKWHRTITVQMPLFIHSAFTVDLNSCFFFSPRFFHEIFFSSYIFFPTYIYFYLLFFYWGVWVNLNTPQLILRSYFFIVLFIFFWFYLFYMIYFSLLLSIFFYHSVWVSLHAPQFFSRVYISFIIRVAYTRHE